MRSVNGPLHGGGFHGRRKTSGCLWLANRRHPVLILRVINLYRLQRCRKLGFCSAVHLESLLVDEKRIYFVSTSRLALYLCYALLFCSLAFLDPRVGHTMDVYFSTFISILCHSDWLFHRESCPQLDVVYPGRAWSSSPACTWRCSLHYFFSPGNSLVSSWCDHSMLASLLWQCAEQLTVLCNWQYYGGAGCCSPYVAAHRSTFSVPVSHVAP